MNNNNPSDPRILSRESKIWQELVILNLGQVGREGTTHLCEGHRPPSPQSCIKTCINLPRKD